MPKRSGIGAIPSLGMALSPEPEVPAGVDPSALDRAPYPGQRPLSRVLRRQKLRALVREWQVAGQSVAFVPTLGNLHAGHDRLVECARSLADRTVVSVFVNPTQFSAGEDFVRYPRTLERDLQGLERLGVDLAYTPDVEDLYPFGTAEAVRVEVPRLSDLLCGAFRPGHFDGVAGVVLRLLLAVHPDVALFGEKDYQQCVLIGRLVADLGLPVRIQRVPTVREPDGLALSSRNQYLTAAERQRAPELYWTLMTLSQALQSGRRDFQVLEAEAGQRLVSAGLNPDYVAIRTEESLDPPDPRAGPENWRLLAAARLGETRLIDNLPAHAAGLE